MSSTISHICRSVSSVCDWPPPTALAVALLRGRVPVRLGLVWFGSCVDVHPPPCHPLYSTLSPRARALRPKWEREGSIRANHASTNPVPTSTQPLVLPSQPLFYRTLSTSFIFQYSNLPFNPLGPPPTERAAERRVQPPGYYPSHANRGLIEQIQCCNTFFRLLE